MDWTEIPSVDDDEFWINSEPPLIEIPPDDQLTIEHSSLYEVEMIDFFKITSFFHSHLFQNLKSFFLTTTSIVPFILSPRKSSMMNV